ncbi:hypothetical protein HAX54_021063, partial [Datura stramonium]|nr:hypothetical protein [Datura stramonium]
LAICLLQVAASTLVTTSTSSPTSANFSIMSRPQGSNPRVGIRDAGCGGKSVGVLCSPPGVELGAFRVRIL